MTARPVPGMIVFMGVFAVLDLAGIFAFALRLLALRYGRRTPRPRGVPG